MGGGTCAISSGPEMKSDNVEVIAVCDCGKPCASRRRPRRSCPTPASTRLPAAAREQGHRRGRHRHAGSLARPDRPRRAARRQARLHREADDAAARRGVQDLRRRQRKPGCTCRSARTAAAIRNTSGRATWSRRGTVGQLLWAQGSYCRNNPNGEWNYPIEPEATPEQTVDWKTWLGPAPKRDVERRAVLPMAEILGLRHGHHRRPVAASAASADARDEPQRVSEVGQLRRRATCADADRRPRAGRRSRSASAATCPTRPS